MSRTLVIVACTCAALATPALARAAVVVVANRTTAAIDFRLTGGPAKALAVTEQAIPAGQTRALPLTALGQLSFDAAGVRHRYDVVPNSVYFVGNTSDGKVDLEQIGLGTPTIGPPLPADAPGDDSGHRPPPVPAILSIPVKILCDQNEIRSRSAWEKRMRSRFDEASRIFRQHAFVEFQIVAVESWQTSTNSPDLDAALREFERAVDPAPARLAIGFSGLHDPHFQYEHLGGTRGPLHTHLLMREWVNQNSEPERLEVLVHELGHFLGAVHSPEPSSVMRIALGDRKSRLKRFPIGFDPINTLAMCLVRDQLDPRSGAPLRALPPATRAELGRVYAEVARVMPDDPTPLRFLRRLDPQAQFQIIRP